MSMARNNRSYISPEKVKQKKPKRGRDKRKLYRLSINGVVQGVGFRPFLYRLAREMSLTGWVFNSSGGVQLEVEGPEEILKEFLLRLQAEAPPLANIESIRLVSEGEPRGYRDFSILASGGAEATSVLVPPDVGMCEDCRREVADPRDRHFHYPFTNCTNCGPRFSITREVPYDRLQTTMAGFTMCPECAVEYHDPADRRFHAQPVACPQCGPQVYFLDEERNRVEDWQEAFLAAVAGGKVIALKGLGGFHLACDALGREAVDRLRQRKNRPFKPLAVMARDLGTVRRYCELSPQEEAVLTGPQAPIVILKQKPGGLLPDNLCPNQHTLGVMLPYTPLHQLLFTGDYPLLVMTSGNVSGLPLVKENQEALEQLGPIADVFLLHNRPIHSRVDDSLVRLVEGDAMLLRRSRGYVPQAVAVPWNPGEKEPPVVLGSGGEMKNTFCLSSRGKAYLSQHLGEIESEESIINYRESLDNFQRLLGLTPQVLAHDLHPQSVVTSTASIIVPADTRRVGVQHHHAHLASCMAEHQLDEPVIGVIMDGTGYGEDGTIWGFEVLEGDYLGYRRRGHLKYIKLTGGEQAVRNPWMTGLSYLHTYLGEGGAELARRWWPDKEKEIGVVEGAWKAGFNSPLTSSAGRLFDAVAAILGVCRESTYEGQAAMELTELVDENCFHQYPVTVNKVNGLYQLDPGKLIRGLVSDLLAGSQVSRMATGFHRFLVEAVTQVVVQVAGESGIKKIVLSGGSFQNPFLLTQMRQELEKEGFAVYYHRLVPANDGGLSLGQAAVAYWRWIKGVPLNSSPSA